MPAGAPYGCQAATFSPRMCQFEARNTARGVPQKILQHSLVKPNEEPGRMPASKGLSAGELPRHITAAKRPFWHPPPQGVPQKILQHSLLKPNEDPGSIAGLEGAVCGRICQATLRRPSGRFWSRKLPQGVPQKILQHSLLQPTQEPRRCGPLWECLREKIATRSAGEKVTHATYDRPPGR